MKKRFLANAPLFSVLNEEELTRVASELTIRRYHKGAVIFEQGTSADTLYLVKSGMLRLVDRQDNNRLRANLGPGSLTGEIDMLLGRPHGATGIAGSDLDVWVLTRSQWERLAAANPTIAVKVSSFLGESVADVSAYLAGELAATELLAGVSSAALEALADRMTLQTVQRGALIHQAGAEATALYYVEEGEVVVVSIEPDHPEPFRQLGDGEFFGQTAVMTGDAYGAVARAATDGQLWRLDRVDFDELIRMYSDLREAFVRRVHDRRPAEIDHVAARRMLRNVPVFADVPEEVIEVAVGRLRLEHIDPDEFLFRDGDAGDALYLIDRGYVRLIEDGREIDERGEGEHLGQMALLTGRSWSYNAQAAAPAILWYLPKKDFDVLVTRFPALAQEVNRYLQSSLREADTVGVDVAALRSFPLFSDLDDDELADIAECVGQQHVPANEFLYRVDHPSERFYLLRDGEIKLTMPRGDVKIVRPGGFFGEIGLLTNSRRKSTAQALTDASLFVFSDEDFESVLMAHPKVSVRLNRALSARLEALEEGPAVSGPSSARGAVVPTTPDRGEESTAEEGLLPGLVLWFAARSTGAKVRMGLVGLLFLWLVGVSAPTIALGTMLNGNGNGTQVRQESDSDALAGMVALVMSPTPEPTNTSVPTETPEPTETPAPTDTPEPEPTDTPEPTETPVATETPEPEPTDTPEPTETPEPPTATPVPPTDTPGPVQVAQAQPEPTEAPPQPTEPPPPPPTNTPEPAPAPASEPGRNLDPRLGALGVSVEPAAVPSGQPYWRVTEIIWHDEQQAEGRHSLYVEVKDEAGERIVGQPVTIRWGDGAETLQTENKPFPEYAVNFPMYAAGQSYSLWVDGLPSDRVHGLGLGDLVKRDWTIHVEYLITFQKVVKP